ncbi:hypothetical protein N9393_01250 [Luminiphilus sp.]|nr:hypothetical protein [Luminiphilus sp.]
MSKEDIDIDLERGTFPKKWIAVCALCCVCFGLLQIYAPLPEIIILEKIDGRRTTFRTVSIMAGLFTTIMVTNNCIVIIKEFRRGDK